MIPLGWQTLRVISCYVFQVGVKITLASSGLTKIITFTPYYMLINQAKVGIMTCVML